MPIYHFQLFAQMGRLIGGRFLHIDDDRLARARAQEMLAARGVVRVEVWREGRQIYETKKPEGGHPGIG